MLIIGNGIHVYDDMSMHSCIFAVLPPLIQLAKFCYKKWIHGFIWKWLFLKAVRKQESLLLLRAYTTFTRLSKFAIPFLIGSFRAYRYKTNKIRHTTHWEQTLLAHFEFCCDSRNHPHSDVSFSLVYMNWCHKTINKEITVNKFFNKNGRHRNFKL